MAIKDNREFVQALEKSGDVVRIKQEVDWDLEAGAIIRRVCEIEGPVCFFEKVKGYPKGYRLLGAPLNTYRKLAVAMGLAPETPIPQLHSEFERRMEHPLKPVLVETGPCKENILLGEEVDLYRFPAPMVHDGDGGRYIGTWHGVASKDPDTGWLNWGTYRLMIHNKRHMGGLVLPGSDIGRMFYGKYEPRSELMPFAAFIGADPLCHVSCMTPLGAEQSEVDYTGALRQEPMEVVKCETNDLLVPAYSEIVLEGEMLPGVRMDEGPFGEFTGYRTSPRSPRPVYRVNAISYRNDPIVTVSNVGTPVDETALGTSVSWAWLYRKALRERGIPFTGVFVPPQMVCQVAIVGVRTIYSNIATRIGNILSTCGIPGLPTMVIVVDADVDVTNLNQVFHALATKCHPARGIRVSENEPGIPLIPFLNLEERMWGKGASVLFDCTWPLDWPKETAVPPVCSFNEVYPSEVRDKVLANWANYGFK
jgi:4-hydroxy-3-polyprenylbenzoate decarboxylase